MTSTSGKTVKVLALDGATIGELSVPSIFETPLRLDLIKKAVVAQQSHRFQPQGRNPMAGKRTTAEGFGVGRGISRVPRIGGSGPLSGRAAFAPGTVGGRLAFPPVTNKKLKKKINRKERQLALRSAIAATASQDLVRKRGHKFDKEVELPIVVSDDIQKLSKATEARQLFVSLGLWDDIDRVLKHRQHRKGHTVHAKGPLIIVGENQGARKAFENFEGVDLVRAKDMSVEALSPGTHAGRLAVWSESAVKIVTDKSWQNND